MCAMHRSIGRLKICVRACRTTGESFAVGIGSTVKVTLTCGTVPGERRGLLPSSWAAVSSLVLWGTWLPSQAHTSPAKPHLGEVPCVGLVLEAERSRFPRCCTTRQGHRG